MIPHFLHTLVSAVVSFLSFTTTRQSLTQGCFKREDFISPGSIRYPLIFTCSSTRPIISMLPSSSHRPMSPVLYNFPLSKGLWIKLSWVFSWLFIYPLATPSPARQISPGSPRGRSCKSLDKIYTLLFATGFPMGTTVRLSSGSR